MFIMDRPGRIVWVSEGYRRFLPPLGLEPVEYFVGHRVEGVIPEGVIPTTQMRRVLETEKPVLIDLFTNRADTFVASRLPLLDEGGAACGALQQPGAAERDWLTGSRGTFGAEPLGVFQSPSSDALQRSPQLPRRASSSVRRSRLVGRPWRRASAGSGARRWASAAWVRASRLSAVSS